MCLGLFTAWRLKHGDRRWRDKVHKRGVHKRGPQKGWSLYVSLCSQYCTTVLFLINLLRLLYYSTPIRQDLVRSERIKNLCIIQRKHHEPVGDAGVVGFGLDGCKSVWIPADTRKPLGPFGNSTVAHGHLKFSGGFEIDSCARSS
jgi:hypothetical protein